MKYAMDIRRPIRFTMRCASGKLMKDHLMVNLKPNLKSSSDTVFLDGNVDLAHTGTSFKSFTFYHPCNKFCELCGLEIFQEFTVDCVEEDGEISEI